MTFSIFFRELDINANKCEVLDECFEFTNKHRKILEGEYDSQFKHHINQDEKAIKVRDILSKLPIHDKLNKLDLIEVGMDLDGNSLDPSAMWDEKSIYPEIETGFTFKPHMNDA